MGSEVEFSGASAGIALLADDKILLLKRGNGGDFPGHWCFPGGHAEPMETPEQTARRETLEETGHAITGTLREIGTNSTATGSFITFARNVAQFEPVLSDEHTEGGWFVLDAVPEPMHPGCALTLASNALDVINVNKLDELEIARLIASDELASPIKIGEMYLWAMRITGTGTTYRSALDEFAYRPPELYLTENFLARCNGLQVIFEHPERTKANKIGVLTDEEFADRSVGSVMLPYINGDEVWGIAKIYDKTANSLMLEKKMSTSPTVVFRNLADNSTISLENGESVLIEGKPSLLDHLAICELGVWDKGGEPVGVLNNLETGAEIMSPEEIAAKAKADAEEKEKMQARMDAMQARMDAMEANMPTPVMKTAADKAKSDAEEKAKADAEEEEKKAKADADAEEEAKKAKSDSAALQARIADMEARIPKALSDADIQKLASTQVKADAAARSFGDSAAPPMAGESVSGYRKRMLGTFKKHSTVYKDVALDAIPDALLDAAEAQVYADAAVAARSPVVTAGMGLREIKSTTEGGHKVSTFVGSINDFMDDFKPQSRKFASRFNTPSNV